MRSFDLKLPPLLSRRAVPGLRPGSLYTVEVADCEFWYFNEQWQTQPRRFVGRCGLFRDDQIRSHKFETLR